MLLLLFLIGFSDDDGFGGVAGEDLQRVVMVDEMEFQTGVFAFAIDVDPFVHVACDYDFVGFEHFDMLAELEVVGIDKGSGYGEMLDRDFVDDADVDESVVEFGFGCDGYVVAKLVAVGKGDEPGFAVERHIVVVDSDGIVFAGVGRIFAKDEVQIGRKAPYFGGFHQSGDIGVEAHTGDAGDDVFVVEDDGVDGVFVVFVQDAYRQGGYQWNLHASSQPVAASARDDAQSGVGVFKSGDHIVDRAVAPTGDNDIVALVGCFAGDVCAVVYAFGIAYRVVKEVLVEVVFQYCLDLFLAAYARDGVDNNKKFLFHNWLIWREGEGVKGSRG